MGSMTAIFRLSRTREGIPLEHTTTLQESIIPEFFPDLVELNASACPAKEVESSCWVVVVAMVHATTHSLSP